MKVLFVDDEPRVLEALERMVHELTEGWEVRCAGSGEDALATLAESRFDVVVSDMRMPGMDGAALLHEVHVRHPYVARIVLSGQTEEDAAMRSLRVAHRVLSKPCKANELVGVVEHAHALRALIGCDVVLALATGVDCLPSPPASVSELTRALDDGAATLDDIGAIVGRDPGMTAKVLQVANSAFFARGTAVADVHEAVRRLGIEVLRTIARDAASDEPMSAYVEERVGRVQCESRAAATRAFAAAPPELRAEAYTAALLRDVGQLLLDPEEAAVQGVTHAGVGGYILGLWGLPRRIVDAVAGHLGAGDPS